MKSKSASAAKQTGKECAEYARKDATNALLFATRDYLESVGWTALVGSVSRIQRVPGDELGNFELVIKFTGGKKEPEQAK